MHDSPHPSPAPARATLSSEALDALLQWWRRISDPAAIGTDKADRAILRRCDSIEAVTRTAAYHRVFRAMLARQKGPQWLAWQQDRLAMVVGLAAHLRPDGAKLATEMHHRASGSDRPRVSELRFRRLLESPDDDSLFAGLRRVLPLVDSKADPRQLALDLFWWGDRVKKQWAYDYYAPPKTETEEDAA